MDFHSWAEVIAVIDCYSQRRDETKDVKRRFNYAPHHAEHGSNSELVRYDVLKLSCDSAYLIGVQYGYKLRCVVLKGKEIH